MYDNILDSGLGMGADYLDIRITERSQTKLEVKDGELEKLVSGVDRVGGIRVLCRGAWGFHSTGDLSRVGLTKAMENAMDLCRGLSGEDGKLSLGEVSVEVDDVTIDPVVDPEDVSVEERLEIVNLLDSVIRENPKVNSVTTTYFDEWLRTELHTSEGTRITTRIPRTVLQSNLTARDGPIITGYRMRVAGTVGLELFRENDPEVLGRESAESAATLLHAVKAPAGVFPLIADPGLTGVFVHEAVGHACEADLVTMGDSILEGRIGERIGSGNITIVDDPTLAGWFGSFVYDDEGVRARKKVLIEDGVLRSYILDRETSGKLGMEPNGGARAESGRVRPLVRMSNTLLEPGDMTLEELFEEVEYGIYAKGTRGGQVDTAKGSFQFNAQEAFLIEKGEITRPLRDVSLSGGILSILNRIDGLGKERRGSPGFCGKGQMAPVGDGGPYTLIKDIPVGGD